MVQAYGTTTAARLPKLPDIPTLREQGLTGFEMSVWHGIYAPKRTPKGIVAKLANALGQASSDKEFNDAMVKLGAVPDSPDRATPAGLQLQAQREVDKWTPIIKHAQAYID